MLARLPDGSWVDPNAVRLIRSDDGGPFGPRSELIIPAQVNVHVDAGEGKYKCLVIHCRDGGEARALADEIGASLGRAAECEAVARRDERWQRAVGMSLEAAEELARSEGTP